MKILHRPVLTTILFGLISGLSFVPLEYALNPGVSGSNAICLILWLSAAGYAFLLGHWSRQKLPSIAYPILLLFLTVFLLDSIVAFFLLTPAVISWIRSGICFPQNGGIKLVVEALLWLAGAALVTAFTPGTVFGWALVSWFFFLLLALYFVIFENTTISAQNVYTLEVDPFEQARRRAEEILSNPGHD